MPVLSINAALNEVVRLVNDNPNLAAYNTWLSVFGQQTADPLNSLVFNQRSVTNWLMPSLEVRDQLPTAGTFTNQQIELVIDVVYRMLSATKAARAANRISAAQEASVLAQFNLAFP